MLDARERVGAFIAVAAVGIGHDDRAARAIKVDAVARPEPGVLRLVEAIAAVEAVVARIAGQAVVTVAAIERVIAFLAKQPVGQGVAGDAVGAHRASNVLDIDQGVGVAPVVCGGAGLQVDRHAVAASGRAS